MDNSRKTGFDDRLKAAADARKAELEKFRAGFKASAPAAAERVDGRPAVPLAHDARDAGAPADIGGRADDSTAAEDPATAGKGARKARRRK